MSISRRDEAHSGHAIFAAQLFYVSQTSFTSVTQRCYSLRNCAQVLEPTPLELTPVYNSEDNHHLGIYDLVCSPLGCLFSFILTLLNTNITYCLWCHNLPHKQEGTFHLGAVILAVLCQLRDCVNLFTRTKIKAKHFITVWTDYSTCLKHLPKARFLSFCFSPCWWCGWSCSKRK